MSREVENKVCTDCESQYKLSYDPNDTNGLPKFCPFCGSEAYEVEDDIEND